MATHVVKQGETWLFETELNDIDGNPIVVVNDAWVTIYTETPVEADKTSKGKGVKADDGRVLSHSYQDPEISLEDNKLYTTFSETETDSIEPGVYYLDVKIEDQWGYETVITYRDRVKVKKEILRYEH